MPEAMLSEKYFVPTKARIEINPKNALKEIARRACVRKKLSHRYLCNTFIIE